MGDDDIDYAAAYRSLREPGDRARPGATDEQLDAHGSRDAAVADRDVLAHLTGEHRRHPDAATSKASAPIHGPRPRSTPGATGPVDRAPRGVGESTRPQVEPMIPSFGPVAGQFMVDVTTHEHDIRGALDAPGARESDAMAIGFAWLGDRVAELRAAAGVGALRVETEVGRTRLRHRRGRPRAARRLGSNSSGRRPGDAASIRSRSWDWDGDDGGRSSSSCRSSRPAPSPSSSSRGLIVGQVRIGLRSGSVSSVRSR